MGSSKNAINFGAGTSWILLKKIAYYYLIRTKDVPTNLSLFEDFKKSLFMTSAFIFKI